MPKDNKKSPESIAKGLAKDIKKNIKQYKSSGVLAASSDKKEGEGKDKPMSMGEIGAKAFKDRQDKKDKGNGKQKK